MQYLFRAASIALVIACFCLQGGSSSGTAQQQRDTNTRKYYQERKQYAVEIPHTNMTANFKDWDTDLAIMFYAPWCKYCKQLYPSWEQIATAMSTNKDLVVGKFNCESPERNVEICQHLGVDRYPSIFFIGYGEFNQAPPKGHIFAQNRQSRVARFNADLYPEAIYDWVRMLSQMSYMNRRWDDLKGIFTGNTRSAKKVENLQKRIVTLEEKVTTYGTELQKYKADELFDSLADNGDPFPLLSQLAPDDANLPFRACVADMGTEYCKYHADTEPFCATLKQCVKEDMVPNACRPAVCPFKNNRGCVVCSACLQKDVIDEYKKVYSSSDTAGKKSAASSTSTAPATATAPTTKAAVSESSSDMSQEDILAAFKQMADNVAA